MIFGLPKRFVALWLLFGLLFFAAKYIPAVRQGLEEIGAGNLMAVGGGPVRVSDNMAVQKFNMQLYQGEAPFYLYVPDAYLNKSIYRTGFDGGLKLIVCYPGLQPLRFPTTDAKYSLRMSVTYSSGREDYAEFYLNNYDIITKAPDEKFGHLYGHIEGRGPRIKLSIGTLRATDDKWFYLDKNNQTFAELTCIGRKGPNNYFTCVTSLLIDNKYAVTTSIPGNMLLQFEDFIAGLRGFLVGLEKPPIQP